VTPDQFATARRRISDRLVTVLARLFLALGSWRDAERARFVGQAVPLVQGTQRTMAALVAAFVAAQANAALGRVFAAPGVPDRAAINLRRGVDPATVYSRPFTTVYTALSEGDRLPRAVEKGSVRLREIAELDLQQTYAESSHAAMTGLPAGARPQFWRRVPIGSENCAMCLIAATQRYRVEALNPIHPGCDCQVQGIFGPDQGQVVAPDVLEQVHSAVEQLTGTGDRGAREQDYRKLIVAMTPEHGELGRMLVRPLDTFTGPGDLP
jgi:hypothetical protein